MDSRDIELTHDERLAIIRARLTDSVSVCTSDQKFLLASFDSAMASVHQLSVEVTILRQDGTLK